MKQYPPIMVVNEQDEPVGGASLDEIHSRGLLHRIVFVLVESPEGDLLLQLRSPDVATYPDCWDVSAGGHVDMGEDNLTAAKRELAEELGIHGMEIEAVDNYRDRQELDGRIIDRFNKVYKLTIPKNTPLAVATDEVREARWFTLAEVRQLVAAQPERATNSLIQALERYYS